MITISFPINFLHHPPLIKAPLFTSLDAIYKQKKVKKYDLTTSHLTLQEKTKIKTTNSGNSTTNQQEAQRQADISKCPDCRARQEFIAPDWPAGLGAAAPISILGLLEGGRVGRHLSR